MKEKTTILKKREQLTSSFHRFVYTKCEHKFETKCANVCQETVKNWTFTGVDYSCKTDPNSLVCVCVHEPFIENYAVEALKMQANFSTHKHDN